MILSEMDCISLSKEALQTYVWASFWMYRKICAIAMSNNMAYIADITISVWCVLELSEFYNQKNLQVNTSIQS